MMFPMFQSRDSNMGSPLSNVGIAESPKRAQKFLAAHIAGELHAAMISSRTKCSRIMLGRSMVSSK